MLCWRLDGKASPRPIVCTAMSVRPRRILVNEAYTVVRPPWTSTSTVTRDATTWSLAGAVVGTLLTELDATEDPAPRAPGTVLTRTLRAQSAATGVARV